jgi:paraquat-inducible protein B
MDPRAHPASIGLFVIGAIVLTIVGVTVLAGRAWFTERETFISFFRESVSGLEVGSPVKFKGVPVGTVQEILIRIDAEDQSYTVPVRYTVDLSRLLEAGGDYVRLDRSDVLRDHINVGLRAQLQLESFVTGQLFLELSYVEEPDPPEVIAGRFRYPQIPTQPSLFANIEQQAGGLITGMHQVIRRTNRMLDELDVAEIGQSLIGAARAVEALAGAPEIRTAMRQVPGVTQQMNVTMAEFQQLATRLGAAVDPIQLQVEGAGTEFAETMQSLRQAIAAAQGYMTADAGVGYQLEEALESLARAADAVRALALSLERNPTMFIRGRAQEE